MKGQCTVSFNSMLFVLTHSVVSLANFSILYDSKAITCEMYSEFTFVLCQWPT